MATWPDLFEVWKKPKKSRELSFSVLELLAQNAQSGPITQLFASWKFEKSSAHYWKQIKHAINDKRNKFGHSLNKFFKFLYLWDFALEWTTKQRCHKKLSVYKIISVLSGKYERRNSTFSTLYSHYFNIHDFFWNIHDN